VSKLARSAKLDTPTARARLAPSPKPYFQSIDEGLHLGYRKGERTKATNPKRAPGRWVLRRYLGGEKYIVETIGLADDFSDADGAAILSFFQAQTRARERVQAVAEEARIASLGPAITVKSAIEEYLTARAKREAHDRGAVGLKHDARSRLTKHVIKSHETLAAKPLAALTTSDLAKWREGLKMAAGSAQRTVNDFKAALNAAARRAKAALPPEIRDTIKDGLATVHAAPAAAREAQVLPDADVRAVISAAWEVDAEGEWEGDLGRLVLVLAATGARFSQIARMMVADVQAAQMRLMIPVSRKGRGTKNSSHVAVRVGDDVLAALRKATAGRKGSEPLLLRPHWQPIATVKWEKVDRGPWHSAAELTRPWAAIVKRAGLAAGTVPYALRHSSIVRGLRAGLPVRLVAALHDTSSAMIERHYAAFIVDAMDELAARAVVPLQTAPATVVLLVQNRGAS
jgi:integrase